MEGIQGMKKKQERLSVPEPNLRAELKKKELLGIRSNQITKGAVDFNV
jgi:hypothetical protein